jgi:hypothetical protein
MAIGTKTGFKIYDDQFFGGMIEVIEQNADAFNAASANTIQLQPARMIGDFNKESFIQNISNLITRRDITSVAAATDLAVQQGENARVKINRKIGPVAQTIDSFRKIGQVVDNNELSFLLGAQVGKAITVDYINTAVNAAVAALSGQANATNDYSATGTITHAAMVTAMGKRGDRAGDLAAWVMHSKVYFDLMGQAIADKVFDVASTTIYNGTVATFGRPTVVIDAPSMLVTGTPNKYWSMALVPGGVMVQESEQRDIINDVVTGLENLVIRMQGEYAFNLGIKGFTWDVTNGGANPTDTAIGTSSNWDKTSTDAGVKGLAGVILRTQ